MIRRAILSFACVCFLSMEIVAVQGSSVEGGTPCPKLVGLLVPESVFGTSTSNFSRIELRQCDPARSESIQIVAWEKDNNSPALVIDTTDFVVVQTVARGNVYLIETTGGPRDRVYVIAYEKGKPLLKLMRVTRGTARVTITNEWLEVVIPEIYAGDEPPRTETHRFSVR